MNQYYVEDDKIKNRFTDKTCSLEEICGILNMLEIEATRTQNDLIHSIELKAVNRHLRMENRVLTMKLTELTWKSMNLNYADIEKEVTELCISPDKASNYIHNFEKENFELKQKLKKLGEYNGDLL